MADAVGGSRAASSNGSMSSSARWTARAAVRLHLTDGVRDFRSPELAAAYAEQVVAAQIEAMARQEGADQVEVRMTQVAPLGAGGDWTQPADYLGTELQFTAAGRPSPARHYRISRSATPGLGD